MKRKPKLTKMVVYLVTILMVVASGGMIYAVYQRNEEMVIGTNTWSGYEILYLAREKGFIDQEKVRLVEYNTTSEVLRGLKTGVINSGALTLDEAIKAYDRGMDIEVVMIFDYSDGADVVIAKDYIKSPSDLVGKRIGVENTALGSYMLKRFLDINGLKKEDVDVVYLELHEHTEGFLEGLVDAVITFEPEKSKILAKEGHIIFSSKQIPMEIVDVLVVKRDYLAANHSIVKSLIESYYQAYEHFTNYRCDALKIMAKRQHITDQELEQALKGITLPSKQESFDDFKKLQKTIDTICSYLKERGEIKPHTDCHKILNLTTIEGLYR